jgi:hypothetical protein
MTRLLLWAGAIGGFLIIEIVAMIVGVTHAYATKTLNAMINQN